MGEPREREDLDWKHARALAYMLYLLLTCLLLTPVSERRLICACVMYMEEEEMERYLCVAMYVGSRNGRIMGF